MTVPDRFRALRIHEAAGAISARFEDIGLADLSAGDTVVRVRYSDINYKDALAATGKGRILKRYPLVGGIDFAGEVESCSDPRFHAGDAVIVTGCGLSETHDGGYAEYARVPADWLIRLPAGLDLKQSMQLGTAGFTAALAVHRMEQNGQQPDGGPVLVTGATGGVGSLAIDMLAGRGYEVVALSGKRDADDYLTTIGATRILRREGLDLGRRPLEAARFAGAIDNLGGPILTWLTRTVGPLGNIASIGLAASAELNTTVLPFILRGVNLLGINSVETPAALRQAVWARLATDLKPRHLDLIGARSVPFAELIDVFPAYLEGRVVGRTVVAIG